MISDNDSRRFDRRGFLGAAALLTLAEPARLLRTISLAVPPFGAPPLADPALAVSVSTGAPP